VFTAPAGKLAVVTVSCETTTMLSVGEVAVKLLASFTLTVKADVPAVVGVPAMVPAALRLNPAGRFPEAIDHV